MSQDYTMAFQIMFYQVSAQCISDVGLIRQNNEDAWKLLSDEQFFVLADGMGGHRAGEVAAKEAVEQLCNLFQQHVDLFHQEINLAKQALKRIIQEVNARIYRLSREYCHLKGMGTTLCCMFLHSSGLIYGHVGDSRIYRCRRGKLEQLTQDHSLLRELIDLGQLSEQQAEEFLYKNIITRAIGTEPLVEPSIAHSSIEEGDLFLMCTDGLSDMVCFKEIQKTISQNSVEEAVSLLVKKAKEKGGHDNITVILVKVNSKKVNSEYESHLS